MGFKTCSGFLLGLSSKLLQDGKRRELAAPLEHLQISLVYHTKFELHSINRPASKLSRQRSSVDNHTHERDSPHCGLERNIFLEAFQSGIAACNTDIAFRGFSRQTLFFSMGWYVTRRDRYVWFSTVLDSTVPKWVWHQTDFSISVQWYRDTLYTCRVSSYKSCKRTVQLDQILEKSSLVPLATVAVAVPPGRNKRS